MEEMQVEVEQTRNELEETRGDLDEITESLNQHNFNLGTSESQWESHAVQMRNDLEESNAKM